MTILQLIEAVEAMQKEMDLSIDALVYLANRAQNRVYKMMLDEIYNFEIKAGRFVLNQPFSRRISTVERKMQEILGETYSPSVRDYLNTFTTVEQATISQQKSYNEIEVSTNLLSPARKAVYSQAEYFLTQAVQSQYIQPVKYLLMQQVATGISIKDSERVLAAWNEGGLSNEIISGRPTPTMDKYVHQVARDSLYKFNGAINDIVAKEYGFEKFIYVGDLVRDSRPLCSHLVNLRRKVALNEMPDLIKKYPRGLYPGTNKDNFIQVTGGYACRHTAIPVKD